MSGAWLSLCELSPVQSHFPALGSAQHTLELLSIGFDEDITTARLKMEFSLFEVGEMFGEEFVDCC